MLEVLYDTATKEVRGWCADPSEFGNFPFQKGKAVVILDCDIPTIESDVYTVDLVAQKVVGNPDYAPAVPRNLYAEIDELRAEIGELRNPNR